MRTEVVALRRRVRRLEAEAEIARRLAAFDDAGPGRDRIYRFIATESANFAVTVLCRVCRVSRSAYYAWARRAGGPPTTCSKRPSWPTGSTTSGAEPAGATVPRGSPPPCGSREQVSEKKVARLMAELGIAGICGRKKVKTTRRDPTHTPAADLVERDFSAEAPDELWLTDVTYIATDEGWLYLCSILDVFTRRLVGWSMADHLRTELCTDALEAAVLRRGRSRFAGTVLHSDHGCQYTSDAFGRAAELFTSFSPWEPSVQVTTTA